MTYFDAAERIRPELLTRLAREAKARGETVNGLLERILSDAEAASLLTSESAAIEMAPPERARAWREWIASHSVSVPHRVDVSRESLYTREDEAF